MKTVEIECKKFEEWDEDIQEKILEKHWDINVDYEEWWDFIYDDATEIGKLMGIDISRIYFTGFHSQGDGACFEGRYSYEKGGANKVREYAPQDGDVHHIADRLQEIQKKYFYRLSANVKHRGHYYHEMCTEIDVYRDGNYMYFKGADEAEEEIIDILRSYMRWIYKNLDKAYDHLTSREAIVETFEANSYEFDCRGKIW